MRLAVSVALAATLMGALAMVTSKAMYQIRAFHDKAFSGAIFVSLGMALNWRASGAGALVAAGSDPVDPYACAPYASPPSRQSHEVLPEAGW